MLPGTYTLAYFVGKSARKKEKGFATLTTEHPIVSQKWFKARPNWFQSYKTFFFSLTLHQYKLSEGNTKEGSITLLLTSCLTGLESTV